MLTSIAINDAGVMSYDLDTTTLAAGTYTIDFYASTSSDGGNVEGERYLGSVTGVASGNSSLTGALSSITLASGEFVTLQTTDGSNNSSEFSNYAVVVDGDAGGTTPNDLQATFTTEGGLSINADGGNDAYLIADDGGTILGGRTALTFEVQFSSTANASFLPLVSYAAGAFDNEFLMYIDSTGFARIDIGSVNIVSNAIDYRTLANGQTQNLAFTWDNTTGDWQIFHDGVLLDSGTGFATGYSIKSGGTLLLGQEQDSQGGGFHTSQVFKGTLHDVCLFSDVRSASEILTNYNSTLPYDESGLIANWTFNDLSSDGIVTDSVSGNNLTVAHTGGRWFHGQCCRTNILAG